MKRTARHQALLPTRGLGLSVTMPRYSPTRHTAPRSVVMLGPSWQGCWRAVVIIRLNSDQRSKDDVASRISQGRTKTEAIRCLKRHVARRVFRALPRPAAG